MPSWLKVLLIVALIMVLIIYLMGSCVAGIGEAVKGVADGTLTSTGTDVTTADAKGDYIGILHVEGTISEGSTAVGYNHNYNLNSISDICGRILLLEKGNLIMDKSHVPGSMDQELEAYFLDAVK